MSFFIVLSSTDVFKVALDLAVDVCTAPAAGWTRIRDSVNQDAETGLIVPMI
jgi:hypothetical protein